MKIRRLHDEHNKQELMCLLVEAPSPFQDSVLDEDAAWGDDPFDVLAAKEEQQGGPLKPIR